MVIAFSTISLSSLRSLSLLFISITSWHRCLDEIVLRLTHRFANTYAWSKFTMRPAYFITYYGTDISSRDIYVIVANRKKRMKDRTRQKNWVASVLELVERKKSTMCQCEIKKVTESRVLQTVAREQAGFHPVALIRTNLTKGIREKE